MIFLAIIRQETGLWCLLYPRNLKNPSRLDAEGVSLSPWSQAFSPLWRQSGIKKKKNKNTKAMTTAATTKPRKRNKLCSKYYRNIGGKVFLETCRFCLEWDQVNHDSVLAEPWKPPRIEIAIAPRWPVPVLHHFPVKAFLLMLNLNPSSLLS